MRGGFAAGIAIALATAAACVVVAVSSTDPAPTAVAIRKPTPTTHPTTATRPSTTRAPTTTTTSTIPRAPQTPSDGRRLHLARTITGDISPKSVVSNDRGLVTAQNMMYKHTVTVYDSDGTLVKTIPDSITLQDFGVSGHPGVSKGAPVEGAVTPDGRFEYVSNYSMYGIGFGEEGSDECGPSDHYDDSYVYRISLRTFSIDQAIKVGAVPKYVAMSPDGGTLLVTNWCSYDLSVIDTASHREVARLPIGHYPRGIAISGDASTAYVGVMGGGSIAVVDLGKRSVTSFGVGAGPRHVVLSPDGQFLYVTLNDEGSVVKIATATHQAVGRVRTGTHPRSMAIAADGRSLYVVNYDSDTISKVRTSDMTVLQNIATQHHPIGIAVDRSTGRVWVACYTGAILMFDDV